MPGGFSVQDEIPSINLMNIYDRAILTGREVVAERVIITMNALLWYTNAPGP